MASLSNINGIFDVHSTGAIQFNGNHGTAGQILKSNGNAAPTWVAASTVIGGPYLPLSGGTLTGATATAAGISFTVGGALTGTTATFNTGAGDIGLAVYTSAISTTPNVRFGRNANEYIGFQIQDRNNRIVFRQDETTGNHEAVFDLWSSTTGNKAFVFGVSDSAGASFSNWLTIENANATFSGLVSGITPTAAANFATKAYVDAHPGSGGTVTSVATGTGLTGGTITTTGTLSIDSTVATLAGSQTFTGNKYFNNFFLEFNSKTLANFNDLNNNQFDVSMYDVYNLATASTGMLSTYGTLFQINGRTSHTKTQFAFNGGNDNLQYRTSWYPNTAWTSFRQIWDSDNLPNPTQGGPYLPLAGGIMSGQIDAQTIEFDGIVNSSAVGALIGRNHAYDTLELRGHGAELMIGSKNQDLHINYRTCNNGAANNTPINWFWRAGSSSSFSNHSFGTVTVTGLKSNSFSNNAGGLLFSAGQTTGTTRSLNLRTTNATNDPSNSDGSNSTGITWGQRTDSQPYYIIKPTQLNFGGGNYSKLTLNWHTGVRIGGAKVYGGTKFYNDAPDIVGETGVIMNVGVGNDNIGVVNALTVGGAITVGGTVTVGGISNLGNTAPSRVLMSDSTDVKYNDLATARSQFNLSYDTFRRIAQTSDTNYWTGVKGWSNQSLNTTIPNMGSGFFDVWSSPAGQPSTETSHWQGSQAFHYTRRSDSGNIYGYQTAIGAGNPAIMYVRGIWGGSSWGSWYRMHNDATALIKINNQISISTDNNSNLKIQSASGTSAAGITGYAGNGTHVFQLYGAGSDYGFLNGNWAAWDLRKTKNGNLYMNNSTTYYLNTSSTSYMNAVTLVGTFSGQNGYFNQDLAIGFNSGAIGGKVNIQINSVNGIGVKNNLNGKSGATGLLQYTSASYASSGYNMVFQAVPPSGTDQNMLLCYINGNIVNRFNSYGQYSDIKLKENIVDTTPKLEDVKKIRIRNFNFKGDPYKQIGVVAQEFEEVFPGLVEDKEVPNEEGTTKTVKYSVLVPILVKAIQELEARVKELENK